MALITEDGTGKTDAESYISVSAADTYFSNRGNSTWDAATTAAKEQALRKATDFLDMTFIWMGRLQDTDQALNWPRGGAFDPNGRELTDEVPVMVQRATAELAVEALSADLLSTQSRDDQVKSAQAGSVAVTYEDNASFQKSFALAERLVAPLTVGRYSGGAVVKLALA